MTKTKKTTHPLNVWIEENLIFVPKLKIQMTDQQCEKIINEFKDKNLIAETLREMDNHKPLLRKYVKVYDTLKNWLKRNVEPVNSSPFSGTGNKRRTGWTTTYTEALSYLDSKKIGYDKLEEQFEMIPRPDDKPLWRKK